MKSRMSGTAREYLSLMDAVLAKGEEPGHHARLDELWWKMTDEERGIIEERLVSHAPKGPKPVTAEMCPDCRTTICNRALSGRCGYQ